MDVNLTVRVKLGYRMYPIQKIGTNNFPGERCVELNEDKRAPLLFLASHYYFF